MAWGIGLSQQFYTLECQVLVAAGQLVAARTRPACVGPVLEPGRNTKAHVLRLVEAGLG